MPNSAGSLWAGRHFVMVANNTATAMQPSLMSANPPESKLVPPCHCAMHLGMVTIKRYRLYRIS